MRPRTDLMTPPMAEKIMAVLAEPRPGNWHLRPRLPRRGTSCYNELPRPK